MTGAEPVHGLAGAISLLHARVTDPSPVPLPSFDVAASVVPQGRQRIDSGCAPGRTVAGDQRRGQQNRGGRRDGAGIVRLRVEQERLDEA